MPNNPGTIGGNVGGVAPPLNPDITVVPFVVASSTTTPVTITVLNAASFLSANISLLSANSITASTTNNIFMSNFTTSVPLTSATTITILLRDTSTEPASNILRITVGGLTKEVVIHNIALARPLTMCYNEALDVWLGERSYTPRFIFNIEDNVYSSDVYAVMDKIYQLYHPAAAYNNFNGQQYDFIFEFILVDNPKLQKILDNLLIIGNSTAPTTIYYEVLEARANIATGEQRPTVFVDPMYPRKNQPNIVLSNTDYLEDHHYVEVMRGIDRYYITDPQNFSISNEKVRDKAIKIRLVYEQVPDPIVVQAVLSLFNYSYN
jgi:hypothetical protein